MHIPFPNKRFASRAMQRLGQFAMILATLLTCVAAATPLQLCSCECCNSTNANRTTESCCCCTAGETAMTVACAVCECCDTGRCDCATERPQQSPLVERRSHVKNADYGQAILPHAIYETRPTSGRIIPSADTPLVHSLRTHALCSVWLN